MIHLPFSSNVLSWIGYLAAFCTAAAFIPQLVRVLKPRSAREVSPGTFLQVLSL